MSQQSCHLLMVNADGLVGARRDTGWDEYVAGRCCAVLLTVALAGGFRWGGFVPPRVRLVPVAVGRGGVRLLSTGFGSSRTWWPPVAPRCRSPRMTLAGSLLRFALLACFVVALTLALLTAGLERPIARLLLLLGPQQRARIAWWLLLGPLVGGVGYVGAVIAVPSLLHGSNAFSAARPCRKDRNTSRHAWPVQLDPRSRKSAATSPS